MSEFWCKNEWSKGTPVPLLSAVAASAASAETDTAGFNAVLLSVTISGTGTWKVDLKGHLGADGTAVNLFDHNGAQLTTGNLTASRVMLFVGVPDLVSAAATKVDGDAACSVALQPFNV